MNHATTQAPRWTPDEDAVLVRAYGAGGYAAAGRALPGRSGKAIWSRVRLLKDRGVAGLGHTPGYAALSADEKVARKRARRNTKMRDLAPGGDRNEKKKALRRIDEDERRAAEGMAPLPRFDSHALLMRLAERMPPRGTKRPKPQRRSPAKPQATAAA